MRDKGGRGESPHGLFQSPIVNLRRSSSNAKSVGALRPQARSRAGSRRGFGSLPERDPRRRTSLGESPDSPLSGRAPSIHDDEEVLGGEGQRDVADGEAPRDEAHGAARHDEAAGAGREADARDAVVEVYVCASWFIPLCQDEILSTSWSGEGRRVRQRACSVTQSSA